MYNVHVDTAESKMASAVGSFWKTFHVTQKLNDKVMSFLDSSSIQKRFPPDLSNATAINLFKNKRSTRLFRLAHCTWSAAPIFFYLFFAIFSTWCFLFCFTAIFLYLFYCPATLSAMKAAVANLNVTQKKHSYNNYIRNIQCVENPNSVHCTVGKHFHLYVFMLLPI